MEGVELKGLEGTLVFPSGVKEIHDISSGASSVSFPNGLQTIGRISFPNVESITFPSSVTMMNGNITLKKVTELTIPGSVKDFKGSIFYCSSLKTLTFEEGLETISHGSSIFVSSCPELETVNFPDSLKSITDRSGMFSGAKALKTVNWPENVAISDTTSFFSGCTSLEEIHIPAGTTVLGTSMFSRCSNLKKVTCGSKLTEVGKYAFNECENLESAPDLSGVTKMGDHAFFECKKMTGDIDLSSLNEIPDFAFQDTQITGVKFSQDLSKIGRWAFLCTHLESVEIPDSVTEIGPYAFFNIDTMKTLKIGDGIESLNTGIFQYCRGLKDIEIGSGITNIDDSVFDNCTAVERARIHTSEDFCTVGDIGSLPHDKIEFTEASIGDVGDNIGGDGPDKDWSLQKAVNEAEDGGTVVIHKHVRLDKTLTIPEGKTVTIKSEDNKYAILAAKDNAFDGGKLIEVGEGRTLGLKDVTIRGNNIKIDGGKGLIDVRGTLNAGKNAVIRDAGFSNNDSAAVRVSGENAVFNMESGSVVTKNRRKSGKSTYSAPVKVTDKAVFNMKGGEISSNNCVEATSNASVFCSSGVFLDKGASMNMTGGTIKDNKAHTGSAIFVDTDGSLTVDGDALIKDNKCVNNVKSPESCGGAVHVDGSMAIKNGTLKGNTSANAGGAIAVGREGKFQMDGGLVEDNSASYGGGIYLYGKDLKLNAGTIKNNKALVAGGGVYVEGNIEEYATAYFDNALITNNTASIMGGGVWTCPTGRADVQNNGAAVYDNSTTGERTAGDDFALLQPKDSSIIQTTPASNNVSERTLGGGHISYYRDGGVRPVYATDTTIRDWGSPSPTGRYEADNALQLHVNNDNSRSFALKSIVDNDDVKTLAESKATLVITGNSAARGGGVGANGGLVFEGGGEKKINIEKVWSGKDPTVDSIKLGIYNGDNKIETVTLTKEEGWKAELTGLPDDLTAADITVKEETTVENFVATFDITDSDDGTAINVVATNTYNEPPLTPDTPEPQNPTPDNPNPTNPDNPVKVTTDNPQSGVPTGDTFPTAVGITALAAGLTAMIAAYIRRRRAAAGK